MSNENVTTNENVQAPAVEQPAAPVTDPAAKADEWVDQTFEPTGDAGLDFALNFLNSARISFDDPAVQAASNGDFALLRAKLAQSGVAGWEQAVALAEQAVGRQSEERDAKAAESMEAVQAVAEQHGVDWADASEWASENATEDEKTAINQILAMGPLGAKIAGAYICTAYSASQGGERAAAPVVGKAAAPAAPQAANGPLTAREFAAETGALYRKYGDDYVSKPEYAALVARRRAGM